MDRNELEAGVSAMLRSVALEAANTVGVAFTASSLRELAEHFEIVAADPAIAERAAIPLQRQPPSLECLNGGKG